MNILINITQENTRLDRIVSGQSPHCSRNRAVELINSGQILVNGSAKKKPGYRVKVGDHVTGTLRDYDSKLALIPQKIDLDILFEDDYILVVNKPAGMVVHPAPGHMTDTLVNALLFYVPGIEKSSADLLRSGIVHRLDKDTTGVMVVAKDHQSLTFLQKEFKQRRVGKKYLALVHGVMPENAGVIDLPIGRHPVKRKMLTIRPEDGKNALTLWRVKKCFQSATLVEVELKTGRTHQIRVHFYALAHPLVGDKVYQHRRFRKKGAGASRQMLHAYKLSFRHPFSGRRMAFQCDPPGDFDTIQSLLGSA